MTFSEGGGRDQYGGWQWGWGGEGQWQGGQGRAGAAPWQGVGGGAGYRVGVDHKQVEDVKVEETGEALQHEVDTKVVPAARLVAIDNSRAMSGPGKKPLG